MAGETYIKRYGAGFTDGDVAKPADSQFLNAVETALLHLIGEDPATDEVPVWSPGLGRFVFQKLTASQIDATANIAKSQLASLQIANADVAAAAAIARSKLDFGAGLVNADIAAAAAIAKSKLGALGIVDADVTGPIAASKVSGVPVVLYDSGALGGNQATIDSGAGGFATTYTHLRIVAMLRNDQANGANSRARLQFNGDTAANYDDSMDAGASGDVANTYIYLTGVGNFLAGTTTPANRFTFTQWDFPFYSQTNGQKSGMGSVARPALYDGVNPLIVDDVAGGWRSTAAINRVVLSLPAGNYVAGSRMMVYGLS